MNSAIPARGFFLIIGAAIGGVLAALLLKHPVAAAQHPVLIVAVALVLLACIAAYVQLAMNKVVRGHDARAETFRIAMMAQFAPELLAREHLKVVPNLPRQLPG